MDIGVDQPRSEDIGEPRNVGADLCVGPNRDGHRDPPLQV